MEVLRIHGLGECKNQQMKIILILSYKEYSISIPGLEFGQFEGKASWP